MDRRGVVEGREEGVPVDALQRVARGIHELDEVKRPERFRRGDLLEQEAGDRDGERPLARAPIEAFASGADMGHPGGEDAVEQRLHQRGAEQGFAVPMIEADAEGFLHAVPQVPEGREVDLLRQPRQGVARIGSEEEGDVGRLG